MRQQHSYPIEAIILKRTDLGEADRVLTLFTPNKGKFHAIAKGIRRPISKKAGHLELLSHDPLHIDDLIRKSALPTNDVISVLTMMELKGMIKQVGSMQYILAR